MKKKSKGFVEGHNEMEGRGDFANMPQNVIMRPYPKNRMDAGGHLDDTITGIDEVIHHSEGQRMRHVSNQK